MIQPSKNAGRLGARTEEARNQPQAGGCLPAIPPSPSQLAGLGAGTAAWHPPAEPGTPRCCELGSPAERGAEALGHHR